MSVDSGYIETKSLINEFDKLILEVNENHTSKIEGNFQKEIVDWFKSTGKKIVKVSTVETDRLWRRTKDDVERDAIREMYEPVLLIDNIKDLINLMSDRFGCTGMQIDENCYLLNRLLTELRNVLRHGFTGNGDRSLWEFIIRTLSGGNTHPKMSESIETINNMDGLKDPKDKIINWLKFCIVNQTIHVTFSEIINHKNLKMYYRKNSCLLLESSHSIIYLLNSLKTLEFNLCLKELDHGAETNISANHVNWLRNSDIEGLLKAQIVSTQQKCYMEEEIKNLNAKIKELTVQNQTLYNTNVELVRRVSALEGFLNS